MLAGPAGAALACGGLVTPNGTINLLRTTTLAAYHQGIEHYVTSFEFAGQGSGGRLDHPAPGRADQGREGRRLDAAAAVIETQPPAPELALDAAVAASGAAEVLLEAEIDSLDITVLKGGALAVGTWARDHGFFLPPDAPEVLEFYAERSPIFLAARFNAERAAEQGVQRGEGTPIHVVIPTPRPWVPLRILALGRQPTEIVAGRRVPADRRGAGDASSGDRAHGRRGPARTDPADERAGLGLADARPPLGLRAWAGSRVRTCGSRTSQVNERADLLTHDLAIDASGFGRPDPVAAGLARPIPQDPASAFPWGAVAAIVAIGAVVLLAGRRLGNRGDDGGGRGGPVGTGSGLGLERSP